MNEIAMQLIEAIETVIEVTPGSLRRKGRKTNVVIGRRCFYFLMREYYNSRATYQWLGGFFLQDHATVLNAIGKHLAEIGTWKEYTDIFEEVEYKFHGIILSEIKQKTDVHAQLDAKV